MQLFVHTASTSRIVFGSNSIDRLPEELERLSLQRTLVLCTPDQCNPAMAVADRLARPCGGHLL